MRLALAASDLSEFAEAFEGSLAIARITRAQPTLLFWLEAWQIETQAIQHARTAIARHPSWHEHLSCAATRQLDNTDVIHAFQGEQIFDANLLGWVYADPKNVRFGFDGAMLERLSRWLGSATPRTEFSLAERWPGSHSGAIGASRAHWEEWSAFAELPRWKRGALPNWFDRPKSILSAWTMMVPRSAVAAADHLHASRAAFTIMVALERYRDTHGRYPESLQSLVPSFLDSVPPDPFTGDSPRYFLIDPATDEHGRGYLAYYVGPGGTDNLGAMPDEASWRGLFDGYYFDSKAVREIDLLFNDPR
jgi:hypothetical protein